MTIEEIENEIEKLKKTVAIGDNQLRSMIHELNAKIFKIDIRGKEVIPPQSDNVFIQEVHKALGFQGGTIYQVIDEIKRLRQNDNDLSTIVHEFDHTVENGEEIKLLGETGKVLIRKSKTKIIG